MPILDLPEALLMNIKDLEKILESGGGVENLEPHPDVSLYNTSGFMLMVNDHHKLGEFLIRKGRKWHRMKPLPAVALSEAEVQVDAVLTAAVAQLVPQIRAQIATGKSTAEILEALLK